MILRPWLHPVQLCLHDSTSSSSVTLQNTPRSPWFGQKHEAWWFGDGGWMNSSSLSGFFAFTFLFCESLITPCSAPPAWTEAFFFPLTPEPLLPSLPLGAAVSKLLPFWNLDPKTPFSYNTTSSCLFNRLLPFKSGYFESESKCV